MTAELETTAERRAAFVNWPIVYEGMDAAGLDALIAFSPAATHYLSGCSNEPQTFVGQRPSVVLAPRHGEPTHIVCESDEPLARSDGWLDDVRTYPEHITSPIATLATVLKERGLERSGLGLENGFLSIADHRELAGLLPTAALLDADPVLARARWLKMPAEIERIQHAVVTADHAVYAAWQRSHAGDTEKQVQRRMIEELAQRGADKFMMFMASGPDMQLSHHSASDRQLMPGDLLTCVFIGFWGGYWSDNERMGSVGPPTAQQRARYKAAYDILSETIELIKPDIEVRELYNYPHAAIRRLGDTHVRAHMGHGMPRTMGHEDPQIQPNVRTRLEPNMLFMLEIGYRVDTYRFMLSHLVQVTDTGHRVLDDWWNFQEMFVFG